MEIQGKIINIKDTNPQYDLQINKMYGFNVALVNYNETKKSLEIVYKIMDDCNEYECLILNEYAFDSKEYNELMSMVYATAWGIRIVAIIEEDLYDFCGSAEIEYKKGYPYLKINTVYLVQSPYNKLNEEYEELHSNN